MDTDQKLAALCNVLDRLTHLVGRLAHRTVIHGYDIKEVHDQIQGVRNSLISSDELFQKSESMKKWREAAAHYSSIQTVINNRPCKDCAPMIVQDLEKDHNLIVAMVIKLLQSDENDVSLEQDSRPLAIAERWKRQGKLGVYSTRFIANLIHCAQQMPEYKSMLKPPIDEEAPPLPSYLEDPRTKVIVANRPYVTHLPYTARNLEDLGGVIDNVRNLLGNDFTLQDALTVNQMWYLADQWIRKGETKHDARLLVNLIYCIQNIPQLTPKG